MKDLKECTFPITCELSMQCMYRGLKVHKTIGRLRIHTKNCFPLTEQQIVIYLVNKPLSAAGISEDNAQG